MAKEYWKRNLTIVWMGQFLTMTAISAVTPFLPLYVKQLGSQSLEEISIFSGLAFAGPFALSLFFAPIWGSTGDKYGRKLMTLRALIGLAIAQILAGLCQNNYQLAGVRILQGALSGFLPAAMALIASNTPTEKVSYALGALQASTAAGNILGPFFGGLIADLFGIRQSFLFVGFLLLFIAAAMALFVEEKNKPDKDKNNSNTFKNIAYVFNNRFALSISIMISLSAFALSFARPVFILYVETFEIDKNYLATIGGILYSAIGLSSTFSSFYFGKVANKKGFRHILIPTSFFAGIFYLAHYFIENVYLLFFDRLAIGFCYGAISPLLFALIADSAPTEKKGGILGAATSFQILGNFFGPIISGYLIPIIGVRSPFIVVGLVFLIISLAVFNSIKN